MIKIKIIITTIITIIIIIIIIIIIVITTTIIIIIFIIFITITTIIMKNFSRRSFHGHHGSKRGELAQQAHSRGSHAFTHDTLTSTQ